MDFELTEEHRLLEQPVREWAGREVGAVISEGTREIHTLMQADDLLGYREDRPSRCALPAVECVQ